MNLHARWPAIAFAAGLSFAALAEPDTAATANGLPDLNADEYFEGRAGGTFGKNVTELMGHGNRVAVAGFRVVFITNAEAHAQVRATYLPGGVETTAAHSSMYVSIEGVDNATRQAITDRAFAKFLEQLKAAGREVVPQSEVEPIFGKLDLTQSTTDKPYEKDLRGRKAVVFTPAGMPMWWWHDGDKWGNLGPFSQHNMRTVPDFSKEINAYVISPTIVVDFAQMQSSGNRSGFVANEAKVGVALQVGVTELHTGIVRATETKGGMTSEGDEAQIRLVKAFPADMEFAELAEVDKQETKGFMAWATGSSKKRSTKVATTDNDRYSAAADKVLQQATGALAKFFKQHSS